VFRLNVYRVCGLLLALLLAGCIQGEATPAPAEIHYGEDVCADCNMIISDPRFAASYAREVAPGRYESLAFDDIGDLVGHLRDHQEWTVAGVWAHDYESEEWIDAETAFYVVSPEIHSPMGHGVAAFGAEAVATAMAADLGVEVMDWNRMRAEMLMHDH
jgi:copper chaperone NosL